MLEELNKRWSILHVHVVVRQSASLRRILTTLMG